MTPPNNLKAEECLLGAILCDDAGRVIDLCAVRGIVPETFFNPTCRKFYEAMTRLHGRGNPIDALTVIEELKNGGTKWGVDAHNYLEMMIDGATVSHAEYHMGILQRVHHRRRIIEIADGLKQKSADEVNDPGITASDGGNALFDVEGGRSGQIAPWRDVVAEGVGYIDRLCTLGAGGTAGQPSGFHNLDAVLRGLRRKEMIVLAARPSQGKTSLALNIAEYAALGRDMAGGVFAGEYGKPTPVAVFSLEMAASALAVRMLCGRSCVNAHNCSGVALTRRGIMLSSGLSLK